ncbi:hypothetical protein FB567DRAFT_16875 [Paraphoma chrysanthemicola]|uniref:Uncharacterized protein n=1 Tax=Paraphoma chrysanthemicola TaxID=798071 RepID=A0A8K0RKQ2_9PLEO|nr:hypothetical protein FB567DRAFT_16875 [Paraphoma chrysanthemicola]
MTANYIMATNQIGTDSDPADWELISHTETLDLHTDRILLLLGPSSTLTSFPILIYNIPKTASLLIHTSTLSPADRHIRLPRLDSDMLTAYFELGCSKLFTAEYMWGELIKLAITAEQLGDKVVQMHVLAVMRKKGQMVAEGKGEMVMLEEYDVAKKICGGGGGAEEVLKILYRLRPKVSGAKGGKEETFNGSWKLRPSVRLPGRSRFGFKDEDGVGVVWPVRRLPGGLSVRDGKGKKFEWPDRKEAKTPDMEGENGT